MRRGVGVMAMHRRTVVAAGFEVLLLGAAWELYSYGRFLVRDQRPEAFANAADVIEFEKQIALFIEPAIQRLAMGAQTLIEVINHYYAYSHVAVTIACLIWLYVCHRTGYRSCRRVLFMVMPVGLLVHAGYPLAPPRVVPSARMLDTLAEFGPSIYSTDPLASVTNQFAAMPSFHVGWSALVAFYVIRFGRSRLRWLALVHPVAMTIAVMATANHYLLDAAVGLALIGAAIGIDERLAARSRLSASEWAGRLRDFRPRIPGPARPAPDDAAHRSPDRRSDRTGRDTWAMTTRPTDGERAGKK